MVEVWRDIQGYEGLYQASTFGNIRSLKKNKITILKQHYDKNGYLKIVIQHNSKRVSYLVHRLVALTFIENTQNKPEVDHINTKKDDNRVSNLKWCTRKENLSNPVTKVNLHKSNKGKSHLRAKKVTCITTGEIFESLYSARKKYNVGHISSCCNGKRAYSGTVDGKKLVWRYI